MFSPYRFSLIALSLSLAAAEPVVPTPARPDPNPPRSFEQDTQPIRPTPPTVPPPVVVPKPKSPSLIEVPEPTHPGFGNDGIRDPGETVKPQSPGTTPTNDAALGDDGIRDPGESQNLPPRPGAKPDPQPGNQGLGDDGIKDPGEGDRTRPRPGAKPETTPASGADGVRDPHEGDDGIRDPNAETPGRSSAIPGKRMGTKPVPGAPPSATK